MKWEKIAISEIADITMGQSPPGNTYNKNGDGLLLLNGPTEFGTFYPECTIFTTDSKRECKGGDLIFCVRGSTTGRMNWADQVYSLGRGVCSISGENILKTKYIKYCIDVYLDGLLQLAGGGTFPNLSKNDICNFNIPYCERAEEMASILSAYDDLIENNLRRIKLLEEKAFLSYKFIVQSANVEEFKINDVCETSGGGTPSTSNPKFWEEGEILWFSPTDLTKHNSFVLLNSKKKITELGLQKSSAKLLPPKTILMTSRASIGYFGLINRVACTNQGFINIIPNQDHHRAYFLFNLKNRKEEIIGNANGSTFLEISKSKFHQMTIKLPKDENVLIKFEKEFEIVFSFIENLLKQNVKLREARDILLPRLMSGEIEV